MTRMALDYVNEKDGDICPRGAIHAMTPLVLNNSFLHSSLTVHCLLLHFNHRNFN
jgi:hypothetical protein